MSLGQKKKKPKDLKQGLGQVMRKCLGESSMFGRLLDNMSSRTLKQKLFFPMSRRGW